jgi:protein-disulfide isomerase
LALLAWTALGLVAAEDTAGTPAPAGKGERAPIDLRDRPVLGSDTAPIVVVEVSSFKCTHCRVFHEKLFPLLRQQYIDPGKVQWVVLNASEDAAEQFGRTYAIARCALRQGKYWDVLDSLFQAANRPPSKIEDMIAKNPSIDRGELELCVRDSTRQKTIEGDFKLFSQLKIRGTPTFLVWKLGADGQRTETRILGTQRLDYFQRVLDELLKSP